LIYISKKIITNKAFCWN